MSVARTSISLPTKLLQFLNVLAKQEKVTKSEKIARMIRKEAREKEMKKLTAQYNELAKDPEYVRESQEWVELVNDNYAKNIAPFHPYESNKR